VSFTVLIHLKCLIGTDSRRNSKIKAALVRDGGAWKERCFLTLSIRNDTTTVAKNPYAKRNLLRAARKYDEAVIWARRRGYTDLLPFIGSAVGSVLEEEQEDVCTFSADDWNDMTKEIHEKVTGRRIYNRESSLAYSPKQGKLIVLHTFSTAQRPLRIHTRTHRKTHRRTHTHVTTGGKASGGGSDDPDGSDGEPPQPQSNFLTLLVNPPYKHEMTWCGNRGLVSSITLAAGRCWPVLHWRTPL
jgi:hypothetical protein